MLGTWDDSTRTFQTKTGRIGNSRDQEASSSFDNLNGHALARVVKEPPRLLFSNGFGCSFKEALSLVLTLRMAINVDWASS